MARKYAISYCAIPLTTKNIPLKLMVVAYNKLNFTNISVSNAKKIEFKPNLLFYYIHTQHNNQKTTF